MIDILLTVYNSEKYLAQQLDSIVSQTYTNWRIIIIDDCSSDKTCDIIEKYKQKYPEKIVLYKNSRNIGNPALNFFKLLKMSTSEYAMFCDHDDVWLCDKIELTLKAMKQKESQNPNLPVLVHTDSKVVDRNLNVLAKSMVLAQRLNPSAKTLKELVVQNNVTGCAAMLNRKLVLMASSVPKGAVMHDWWVALIASAFGAIEFVDRPTILYRQHGANQVGFKNASKISYVFNKFLNKREIKSSVLKTYIQCRSFLNRYRKILSPDQKKLLESYLRVGNGNKLQRVSRLVYGGFLKHGFFRKLGQVIYI